MAILLPLTPECLDHAYAITTGLFVLKSQYLTLVQASFKCLLESFSQSKWALYGIAMYGKLELIFLCVVALAVRFTKVEP